MESDLEIWEMAKIIGKWLRYMVHGLSIWETAWLSWKCLKNLTNGSNMYGEMTYIFGNWLKCLRNGQKKLGNDVDLLLNGWEICGEMT